MKKYETYRIDNLSSLKDNTIYFFLKSQDFSEHQIKELRKNEKSFILNDNYCTIKAKLSNGDKLQVLTNPQNASQILACDRALDILYEDDYYLIVNKPHLLASVPTRSHYNNNLGGRIMNYMNNKDDNFVLRIVNRLDKDTAGIVITAKSASAYNRLGKIDKTYYALCHGNFNEKEITINAPILTISKNGINQMKRIISPNGKPSITYATLVKQYKNFALIKLKLETGRTHQIRVHLSHIGHSLLGDKIYSNNTNETDSHTFLILKQIAFTHPTIQKQIKIEIPYPSNWNHYLEN